MTQISIPSTLGLARERTHIHARAADRGVTRHYRIGPVPVSLYSELPGIAHDFHRFYEPYQVFAPAVDSFRIEVRPQRSWRSLRRYIHIRTNGREQCVLRSEKSVLPFVEWTMNALVARFLPGYLQIHAATMSLDGQGVILAGAPGQGKSTLAAGLLARGWSYLSDEFALIHPDTRLLEPYPKALCIKSGSFAPLLKLGLPLDLDRVMHKGSKGPVSLLDPLAVRPDAVSSTCPVRMIVFPQYCPDAEPAVEGISRAQAVFELVRASFNFTKFRGPGLEVLVETVRHARCVRVRSGDLNRTGELIEQALRGETI
ncbi:MAG TPA: hypothetical protein PLQ89_10245 [Phycisphaerae bacterium]|nr:hypothetical protein [Phycisphaerae bacterium]HOM53083.1 hypothetical protein [Phycisphaerae bacterium]HOQ86090.1 hypothetical protein [Phycisphaerae bacterium]HPP25844.1 hypothetical protein [Phycisphaerae bacterium]HPU26104.1 hypothetical protein [Phycisphaerae bacterium]